MLLNDPFGLSDEDLGRLIEEDVRFGDLTTRLLGIGARPGRMVFRARDDLVLCGSREAGRLLALMGARVRFAAAAGTFAPCGTLLLEAEGDAAALHAGWKLAQTLMEWASGIATATHRIVVAARAVAPGAVVLCTRKTVPLTKKLALAAVMAGGGEVHRAGLSETIMLFREHRAFLETPGDLRGAVALMRARAPERAVMIEVDTVAEALDAAQATADVIQLEKFSPDAVRQVAEGIAKRPDGRPVLAAAGGINAQNAAAYAAAGADTLVTSSPFYAGPVDIQVRLDRDATKPVA